MKVVMPSNKMNEYFQVYEYEDNHLVVLIKNLELVKYCKNNKPFYTDDNNYTSGIKFDFVIEVEPDSVIVDDGINGISDIEYIIFEFDNEEEAFYFKLKYC